MGGLGNKDIMAKNLSTPSAPGSPRVFFCEKNREII